MLGVDGEVETRHGKVTNAISGGRDMERSLPGHASHALTPVLPWSGVCSRMIHGGVEVLRPAGRSGYADCVGEEAHERRMLLQFRIRIRSGGQSPSNTTLTQHSPTTGTAETHPLTRKSNDSQKGDRNSKSHKATGWNESQGPQPPVSPSNSAGLGIPPTQGAPLHPEVKSQLAGLDSPAPQRRSKPGWLAQPFDERHDQVR